jgi:TM2 domain-containing membrane protein YozV
VKCGVQRGLGTAFCNHCGNSTQKSAAACLSCGVALSAFLDDGLKSKTIAGLLGIFLGALGLHNFYLGYTKKAIIQLGLGVSVVFTTAAFIWGFIEGILILMGKITVDSNGTPLKD